LSRAIARRLGRIARLQALDARHRAAFADRGRGPVPEITELIVLENASRILHGFAATVAAPDSAAQAEDGAEQIAQRFAAVAAEQPAELVEEDAGIGLIELDPLRVGVAEAAVPAPLLELREAGEGAVGALGVPESRPQRVNRRIGQPSRLRAIAPPGERLAQPSIANPLLAVLVAPLRRSRNEPASISEAAHQPLQQAAGHEFGFEGLE